MWKLSPQPQRPFSLGLEKTNSEVKRSSCQSMVEPMRNMTAAGSIKIRTPLSSTSSSRRFLAVAYYKTDPTARATPTC